MTEDKPVENTDRDLYSSTTGDYYSDRIFITAGGGIGFSVGGHCIVKPLRDWFNLGLADWEHQQPHHGIGQGPVKHQEGSDG